MTKPELLPAGGTPSATAADVAMARACAAAAEAYQAVCGGPLRDTVAIIAAGRAAAEHFAGVFNDPNTVNLLAAVAVRTAQHRHADRDDLPF